MSGYDRINELASKINNLLEAAGKNNGQFSSLDKDLMSGYVRELYEAVLTIQPDTRVTTEKRAITEDFKEEKPVTQPSPNPEAKEMIRNDQPLIQPVTERPSPEIIINEETKMSPPIKKTSAGDSSKKSISEIYAEKDELTKSTLNEKYKNQGKIIADKLKQTPIRDLKAYIGLNKRFTFINSLFSGSEKEYEEAINRLNNFRSYEEAINFIENRLLSEREWKDDEPLVAEFFNLVMRRYLS